MDIGDICDYCEERDCKFCSLGNPCLGCDDYDLEKDICKSKGACGEMIKRDIIIRGDLSGFYDEDGNFVALADCGLTDEDMDRYSAQVQNGDGYYNSDGRFKYYYNDEDECH